MPRITLGNKLYLYDLLVREVGVGKQTMLARVEEVLLADDIMPCDLGCEDTRELLEALDDFVRLTVFKRGRVYATVLDQPQWNEVLARLASEAESPDKGAANVGGPKAWKRKKSKKDPRPAKPRPYGRPEVVEEPEAAEPEAEVVEAEEAAEVATKAGLEVSEAVPAASETEVAEAEGETDIEAETEVAAEIEVAEAEVGDVASEAKPTAETPEVREVAEVEKQQEATADTAEKSESEEGEAKAETPEPDVTPAEETPAAESQEVSSKRKPRTRRRRHVVADTSDEVTEKPATQEVEAATEVPTESVAEPEQEPEPEPEPASTATPQPIVLPPTFWDPVPAPAPRGRRILPGDFISEVLISNEALAALYEAVSWDTNPVELLSKSWEAAKEERSFTREDGIVSFRLMDDLSSPTEEALVARIRPMRRTAAGKRWRLL